MCGESVGVELAVNQFAVDMHIEDSAFAGDEFGVDVFRIFDCGRQTGGLWLVVSLHAVFD